MWVDLTVKSVKVHQTRLFISHFGRQSIESYGVILKKVLRKPEEKMQEKRKMTYVAER